jgi:ubiquinone/menaquinone biosynthesis C-methylase UbiE
MKNKRSSDKSMDRNYRISAWGIRIMHNGWIMRMREKSEGVLADLGLRPGDTVLEPGCGPGYYTEGAAKIVGNGGAVYAYDVNPYLIGHLERKVKKRGLSRVHPVCGNAAESGLDDSSVDFSFITGIPRVVGGFPALLAEILRTLKEGGILAYRSHRGEGIGDLFSDANLKLFPDGRKSGFEIYRKAGG